MSDREVVGDINHVPGILNFASAEGRWWFDWAAGGGCCFRLDENVQLCIETVIEAFVTMMIALWMRLVNSIQLQLCVCGDPISFLLSLAPRWL